MTVASADTTERAARSRWRTIRRVIVGVLIVFEVIGIFSAVEAIMETRTAPGAIAWSISLVTVPVVAVPAYWVFGRSKFEGYIEARKENQDEFDAVVADVRTKMESSVHRFDTHHPASRFGVEVATFTIAPLSSSRDP
jgi:cardiolipin synthase